MHAAVFMLAAGYTLARDAHVRVDVFYRDFNQRQQALVDACGAAFFLLPVGAFFIWSSWDYVVTSWEIREGSREAGGLLFPWPSILKTLIPVMAVDAHAAGAGDALSFDRRSALALTCSRWSCSSR